MPNHYRKLYLPVGLRGHSWHQHLVIRTHHRVGGLHEHHRFGRNLGVRLACVVVIVQADADDLPGPGDRRPYAFVHGIALLGQISGRHSRRQPGQPVRGEESWVVIGCNTGRVQEPTVRGKYRRLLATDGTNTGELQQRLLIT